MQSEWPRRIVLIGTPGSGKTTLATQLAPLLNLEIVHRDAYQHHPDDRKGEFPAHQRQGVLSALRSASSGWILDGAPYWYEDEVYPFADMIVALDYPKLLVLWRCIRKASQRRELGELLDEESSFRWALRVHGQRRQEIAELEERLQGRVMVHKSPYQTREWLRELASDAASR